MKRTLFVLLLPFLLGGCAQLFDANLYATLDPPPPLDKGALSTASVTDIKSMVDDSFLDQLKSDPGALTAIQDNLGSVLNNPSTSSTEALAAGAALIEITAGGSGVADLTDNAVQHVTTLGDEISAGRYTSALKIFMGDKSEAEIKATLDNLLVMASSLTTMQTLSRNSNDTVDSGKFFSGASNKGDFAISALMASVSRALIADRGGSSAALATILSTSPITEADGNDMAVFKIAVDADPLLYTITASTATPGSGYKYAYVAILQDQLPIPTS